MTSPQSCRLWAAVLAVLAHLASGLLLFLVHFLPWSPVTLEESTARSVSIVLLEHAPQAPQTQPGDPATPAADAATQSSSQSVPAADFRSHARLIPSLGLPRPTLSNQDSGLATSVGLAGISEPGGATAGVPLAKGVPDWVREEQARLQAARPVGEPAQLALFGGTAVAGRSFIFVIDRSRSMARRGGHVALERAEQELQRALTALQPHHRFQVIAYNDRCEYLGRRELLPATADNQQLLSGFLTGLVPLGGTEHDLALRVALSHSPDVIFLLTDGGDPGLSPHQIDQLTRLSRGRTQIHCLEFGLNPHPPAESFLQLLAARGDGQWQYVPLAPDMK